MCIYLYVYAYRERNRQIQKTRASRQRDRKDGVNVVNVSIWGNLGIRIHNLFTLFLKLFL